MNLRSLVLLIGLSALGHAVAQIGNTSPSALSSQGSTAGRQVQSTPQATAAGVAQSPAVIVSTPAAASKTGSVTPSQMTKSATPSRNALPPSTGALKIVEPAEGSTNLPGAVRLRIAYPREFEGNWGVFRSHTSPQLDVGANHVGVVPVPTVNYGGEWDTCGSYYAITSLRLYGPAGVAP